MSRLSLTRVLLSLALLVGMIGMIVRFTRTVPSPSETTRPTVAATIFPLYDLVRQVAGDALTVELILPPGASPHTFEVLPQTVRALEQSELVFAIGHGLDQWVIPYTNTAGLQIVDDQIQLRTTDENDDDHGPVDPHYFLSVSNAIHITQNITDRLITHYPDNQSEFEHNRDLLITELKQLREQSRQQLETISDNRLITFHDAWYYFAEDLGLEVIATFEPQPGREPTPAYLAQLTQTIQNTGVKTLYAEPQFSSASIQAFLNDLQINLGILDPLGGTIQTPTYQSLITQNVQTILEHQK